MEKWLGVMLIIDVDLVLNILMFWVRGIGVLKYLMVFGVFYWC